MASRPTESEPAEQTLEPLSTTTTENTDETDDDTDPLGSIGRIAAAVFRLARAVPQAGLSASGVRLAVRSFALRHGQRFEAAQQAGAALPTIDGNGSNGLFGTAVPRSATALTTARDRTQAGAAVAFTAESDPELRYEAMETRRQSREQTDSRPQTDTTGGTEGIDRTARPDRSTGQSERGDRDPAGEGRSGSETPVQPTGPTALPPRDDGPERDDPPTLSDLGIGLDADRQALSADTDRVVERLYRAFERRLRTERRRGAR